MKKPSYINLFKSGELCSRKEKLYNILENCTLCPRNCGVNRKEGEKGFCGAGDKLKIAKFMLHNDEEPVISGSKGAGNIFFSHCNLRCVYCQNYEISQYFKGHEFTPEDLAEQMLLLQEMGAHNINLVSSTHYLPLIADALLIAARDGLCIPLVYNSNGYESVKVLKLLDGVIDIYLPDSKYSERRVSKKHSYCEDYVEKNKTALIEMYRQAGCLKTDSAGIAYKGLIIRHLILPENISGSDEVFDFISGELSPDICVSVMSQYFPVHKACHFPGMNRRLTDDEYDRAIDWFWECGLHNGWMQELSSANETYVPDFDILT